MSEHICPNCKEPNHDDDALLCIYCGESLRRESGIIGRMKYTHHKSIFVTAIILIVLAFCVLMLR
ncbi:MAG: zinc-ribbon domain-containing protein [Candidatus Omnitrophica bacterium]|nr:zinc-ribbon domain-containing protein [Candidatus Omnitrophota bacterium]MBU4487599.1 zinc-ribbon domain-containing protein [Candidatus Omnitrophota bacterium]MCG2705083.1 hypothetical protein [Candidatus Omnitrophota bacterium]